MLQITNTVIILSIITNKIIVWRSQIQHSSNIKVNKKLSNVNSKTAVFKDINADY